MYCKLLPLVLVFLLWLELPVILACPPTPTPVPSPIDTPTPEPTLPPLSTPVRPTNEPTPVPLPVIVTPKPKPKHISVPPTLTPITLLPITGAEATPMLRKYPVMDVPWCSTGFLIVAGVLIAMGLLVLGWSIAASVPKITTWLSRQKEQARKIFGGE